MTVMTLHFWSWISADQTQLVKTADSLPERVLGCAICGSRGKLIFFTNALYFGSSLSGAQVRLRQAREDIRFMAVIGLFQQLQCFLLLSHQDAGFRQNASP